MQTSQSSKSGSEATSDSSSMELGQDTSFLSSMYRGFVAVMKGHSNKTTSRDEGNANSDEDSIGSELSSELDASVHTASQIGNEDEEVIPLNVSDAVMEQVLQQQPSDAVDHENHRVVDDSAVTDEQLRESPQRHQMQIESIDTGISDGAMEQVLQQQSSDAVVNDMNHHDDAVVAVVSQTTVTTIEAGDQLAPTDRQFKALCDQLGALLIDREFTSNAPESAVYTLNTLKTSWTAQASVFSTTPVKTQAQFDVLKRDSLQSLAQVKRELTAQGNLWHRYVRPLLNALISWLAYVESCLGVPHRFQPRLFKATYAEEAFQALQPDDRLREVHDAYARDMSAAAAVLV